MPPSPSSRCSPVRELRVESSHKRGQSFESRFPRKAKDDDLVLFNEMQNRERDNFLLLPSDDFDESISNLRYFSDFKLGISIPARGESSELLRADGEKNDYDWLLTPPDTPLFPSLEDDVPQAVNAPRGRARSQPISISRTSTYEKTPRTNRSSASPHRSSPSPRSSYSATYSRARPSSVPRFSPPPILRPRSPSPRPSTPPTKPSPPAQRSLTPTLRRMSTGSTGPALTGIRGTSPVKKNCGNSASPKLRGWQTDLPGFSTEAPPNLRTSLTDRSVSRMRGLSPASSTRRGCMPKYGRQSVSPSSSKSAVSSHNSEGDPFCSVSKPSAASSCEDDVESHAPLGVSPDAATRKYRDFANSRTIGLSKKPSRSPSASSAPKRSFDLALRQTDHRKSPQNMFRPLLSSVPATTFYSGKTNTVHRPMFSRNSSLTTSSNASSDHGASVALYLDDSDHDQSDLVAEWDKRNVPDGQEEVFVFDKLDEISEDAGNETCSAKHQSSIGTFDESVKNAVGKLICSTGDDDDAVNKVVACQGSSNAEAISKNGSAENLTICSNCGKQIIMRMGVQVVDVDVCQECSAPYGLVSSENTSAIQVTIQEIDSVEEARICSKCGKSLINIDLVMHVDVCQECSAMYEFPVLEESRTMQVANQESQNNTMSHERQSQMVMPELCESTSKIYSSQYEPVSERGATHLSMDTGVHSSVTTEYGKTGYLQELLKPHEMNAPESSGKYESSQSQKTSSLNGKVDDSEGTGIAVLLMNRSNSRKWPVVLGKVISATNILTADPSYGGVDSNSMKLNLTRDGSSTSSSIDLGLAGLTDGHILRQLSCRKNETDNGRGESHISACSYSDKFIVTTPVCPQIEFEEVSSCILMDLENDGAENIIQDVQKPHKYFGDADLSLLRHTFTQQTAIAINASSYNSISSASSDLLLQTGQENSVEMCNTFVEDIPGESCDSHGSSDKVPGTEAVAAIQNKPFTEDNYILSSIGCHDDVSYSATHSSPLVTSDQQNDIAGCQGTQNDYPSPVPNCSADFQEECISTILDNELLISELKNIIPEDPSPAEPTKIVDPTKKHLQRSLTLEEATDTILFCSSIVHDIAYKAATIAVEKELIYESSHPPVAFMVSNVSNHKDLRKASNKHTQSPRKVKRKKAETTNTMPSIELANNVNKSDFATSNVEVPQAVDSVKPPKLESKCNCTVM